jgi:hypothetical protein
METITKKCQYCGKEITSLYEKQADYNLKAHELTCKKRPDLNKKRTEVKE